VLTLLGAIFSGKPNNSTAGTWAFVLSAEMLAADENTYPWVGGLRGVTDSTARIIKLGFCFTTVTANGALAALL
jgi:hypothetical protein